MRPLLPLALAGGNVEGLAQLGELGLALGLSALIGLEREIRQKSAGLRTHCLVGVGAGLIFVRRDSVRGLTTAASIWVTAAIGAAAGAALPLLAVAATAIYLVVALVFPLVSRRLPSSRWAVSTLRVRYPDGRGLLREILRLVTERGFSLAEMETAGVVEDGEHEGGGVRHVEVALNVFGQGSVNDLATELSELPGVEVVQVSDVNVESE